MHPILFRIFGWPVYTFGALLAAAFLIALWRLDRYAARIHLDRNKLNDLVIWLIASVIVGCRVLYFVVHPDEFSIGTFFQVWKGGLVFYGGFILVLVVGTWKVRQYGLPLLRVVDVTMVSAFLGVFIGRWGCLMVGDDYGREVSPDFILALHVPDPLPEGSLFPRPEPGQPLYLHPTQIYMSLNGLCLFLIGHWILKRQKRWGTASSALLLLYAITRSVIEIYRGDYEARGIYGALSTSQWISIPIALAGVAGLVYFLRHGGEDRVFEKAALEAGRPPPATVAPG